MCNVIIATDDGWGRWSLFESGSDDDSGQRSYNNISLLVQCPRVVAIGGHVVSEEIP
jgi:hypothetical protein